MRVKYWLNKSVLKERKTIYAHIFVGKQRLIMNTGQEINPAHWDNRKQRATGKGSASLNEFLNALYDRLFKIHREILQANFEASEEFITTKFIQAIKPAEEVSFFNLYDQFLNIRKPVMALNTLKKYNNVRNILKSFEQFSGQKLTLEGLNFLFLDRFVNFMLSNNHTNTTIAKHVSTLKAFLNWSVERELNKNLTFQQFKVKFNSGRQEVIFLNRSELTQLEALSPISFSPGSNVPTLSIGVVSAETLSRVKDLFLFACYTGARFSDVQALKFNDIKGNSWSVITQKTQSVLTIPLNKKALDIIIKYRPLANQLPQISNQRLNEYLKILSYQAGLNSPTRLVRFSGSNREETTLPKYMLITTHTARRTFITLSIEAGMNPEAIMKITGHSTYSMMKKYLQVTDTMVQNEYSKAWEETDQKPILNLNSR